MKEGMKSVWQRVGQAWLDYLMMTVGALIYAASIVVLIQPANIPLGGVSGLALLANYLFELPTGAMILLLNLPLFFISRAADAATSAGEISPSCLAMRRFSPTLKSAPPALKYGGLHTAREYFPRPRIS